MERENPKACNFSRSDRGRDHGNRGNPISDDRDQFRCPLDSKLDPIKEKPLTPEQLADLEILADILTRGLEGQQTIALTEEQFEVWKEANPDLANRFNH